MLARCVWFCSYLCKVCPRVSESLLLVLRTLSLSFPTNNPSSDSKAFLRFIAFSGSPTAVHCAFLSSMRRHGQVTNWSLHVHNGITLCTYLSQTHRPIALHCMHYGITLWAYLSEPLVKDSHKRSTENTIPRAPSHVITLPLRTCYGEVYGNIAREENGWLSHGIRKFITLLTFELSDFRENGFLILLHFPRCTRWYLSLDA